MIKINQNTDFLSSSSSNGIENLEQKNIFVPLDVISENKISSDLNLFSLGNIPQLHNHEINSNPNDSSFNSDDEISSKKSEIEIDFISKNEYQKFEQKNDINKLFQNDISFPFMNKYDEIKGPIEHIPVSTDKNEECNLNFISNEKITEKKK